MALQMPSPTKHLRTGIYHVRKAIPAPLRATAKASFGVSAELIENLRTKDPREAKLRAPGAIRRLEERLGEIQAAHERMQRPQTPLTDADIEHLTRRYIRHVLAEDEEHRSTGSGEAELYKAVAAQVVAAGGHRMFAPSEVVAEAGLSERDYAHEGVALYIAEDAAREALARRNTTQFADELTDLLTAEGLSVPSGTPEHGRLASAFLEAQVEAIDLLARRHEGELVRTPPRPTPIASSTATAGAGGCSVDELLLGWAADRGVVGMQAIKGDRNSYDRMRTVERLAALLGHRDAAKITKADAVRWKADMQARNRAVPTIRNDLSEMSAIWRWGIANGKAEANPFVGIHPPKPKKRKVEKRGFTDDEAAMVLRAAREQSGFLRWLPWALALTGARLNEVCQSTKDDVIFHDGVRVLRIHEEGEGRSVKNKGSIRMVPLHPVLLQEGFGDYVDQLPKGASLFPDLAAGKQFGRKGDTASKKLRAWVRGLGLNDIRLSPAHSWRHWFITACRKVPLPPDVRDAITGHAGRISESANYGDDMRTLVQQLNTWMVRVAPPAGLSL